MGINCTKKDYCYNSPCGQMGNCHNFEDSFLCICDPQWTGRNCETFACENSTCVNGYCQASTSDDALFDCNCTRGWIGPDCNVLDPCTNLTCENGGKCKSIIYPNNSTSTLYGNRTNNTYNATAFCSCSKGWKGDQCSIDINECLKNDTCHGHGICNNSVGGFSCDCLNGYTGLKCDTNIDECL